MTIQTLASEMNRYKEDIKFIGKSDENVRFESLDVDDKRLVLEVIQQIKKKKKKPRKTTKSKDSSDDSKEEE